MFGKEREKELKQRERIYEEVIVKSDKERESK
jgi:hypothetical protein